MALSLSNIIYYPGNNLIQMLIQFLIFFMISILFAIFSPLGIGFAIFSIIRAKTLNLRLRKVSFVFQVILSILILIIGILIVAFLLIGNYTFNIYNIVPILAVFLGVGFVFALEIGIIVWQSAWLRKKETTKI